MSLYVDKNLPIFKNQARLNFGLIFQKLIFLLEDDAVANRGQKIVEVEIIVNACQPTMLFSKFHQSLSKPMV